MYYDNKQYFIGLRFQLMCLLFHVCLFTVSAFPDYHSLGLLKAMKAMLLSLSYRFAFLFVTLLFLKYYSKQLFLLFFWF